MTKPETMRLSPIRETPYSVEEQRVCDYLQRILNGVIGCGNDPIGFLIASHEAMSIDRSAQPAPQADEPDFETLARTAAKDAVVSLTIEPQAAEDTIFASIMKMHGVKLSTLLTGLEHAARQAMPKENE